MTAERNQIPEAEYQRILDEGKNEGKMAVARVPMAIGTDIVEEWQKNPNKFRNYSW
jgi:hypothetical protein